MIVIKKPVLEEAYQFTGSVQSCSDILNRLPYAEVIWKENTLAGKKYKTLVCIEVPCDFSNAKIYPSNYIIYGDDTFEICTEEQFLKEYEVIKDET